MSFFPDYYCERASPFNGYHGDSLWRLWPLGEARPLLCGHRTLSRFGSQTMRERVGAPLR